MRATARSSFKNPNLMNLADKQRTVNSTHHITFSNLPSARPKTPVNQTPPSANQPPYMSPTKTIIFGSTDSVIDYFDFKQINSIEKTPKSENIKEIYFSNPFEGDDLLSSLLISFISSYFPFLSEFTNICPKGEISLKNALKEFQTVTFERIDNNISKFVSVFQSINISIVGPMHFDSLSDLEVILQAEFEKNKTEDIIILNNLKTIPPNQINVKSLKVENILNTNQQCLTFEYKLRWAIASKGDKHFPVVFHRDYTADVLYGCTLSHLFGSMSSLIYSGAKVEYMCYSLRDHNCPPIRICTD